MPTPSMLQAATTHNWVSSLDLSASSDLHKPEVYNQLVRKYGDQNMLGFLETIGSMNPVSAIEYIHYEDDWLHEVVSVGVQAGGAANAAVTLTVAAGFQYNYSTTAQTPYIVASNTVTNPLIENDVIQFPNGVQAIVKNVSYSAGTFDAYPRVLGTSIPPTATTDQIIITGSQYGEMTSQPEGRNGRVNTYKNNLQIFKRAHITSGTEMGQQIWVTVPGLNGTSGYLWYYKGQYDEYMRFKNEMEVSLITGQKTTNTTFAAVDNTNVSTEGLIPFIENFGNVYNYSLLTGITLADFETIIATQLDVNRGAKENTLWVSTPLRQGIDRFLRDTMKNGGITYGAFSGDQQKAVNLGFDSFNLTGYTFHMKTYEVFTYPKMLGASGQAYSNMGIIVPADNRTVSLGPDKGSKVSVPSVRINYLKGTSNNYSRYMEEFLTGAVNGIYTERTDRLVYDMRSHCGFEGFAPNRFALLKGV